VSPGAKWQSAGNATFHLEIQSLHELGDVRAWNHVPVDCGSLSCSCLRDRDGKRKLIGIFCLFVRSFFFLGLASRRKKKERLGCKYRSSFSRTQAH